MRLTTEEARRILHTMNAVFDVVRFVDPIDRVVLVPMDDGWEKVEKEPCHCVWNQCNRCANCVSIRSYHERKRMTKYEFIDENVYSVVARPVTILDVDAKTFDCCLEMVCEITDEILFDALGKGELIEKIIESEKRVYTDSLTGVYNRRFYDERAFCHRQGFDIGECVTFIMADFKAFKQINDNYGHEAGDRTLSRAAAAMKGCVRPTDAVIRMGGDEFLIVLADCGEDAALDLIARIEAAFAAPLMRPDGKPLVCNFGICATTQFSEAKVFIDHMLSLADKSMYEDKRNA